MSFARNIALAVKKHPCQVDDSKWASLRMWAARWYCRIAIKLSAHFNTSSSCPWLKLAAWLHQYTAVSGSWKLMIQSTITHGILLPRYCRKNSVKSTIYYRHVFSKLIWRKKCVAVQWISCFSDMTEFCLTDPFRKYFSAKLRTLQRNVSIDPIVTASVSLGQKIHWKVTWMK